MRYIYLITTNIYNTLTSKAYNLSLKLFYLLYLSKIYAIDVHCIDILYTHTLHTNNY